MTGYVYVTFENEKSVRALLTMCRFDPSEGGQWYYQVSSKRMRSKEVGVAGGVAVGVGVVSGVCTLLWSVCKLATCWSSWGVPAVP